MSQWKTINLLVYYTNTEIWTNKQVETSDSVYFTKTWYKAWEACFHIRFPVGSSSISPVSQPG